MVYISRISRDAFMSAPDVYSDQPGLATVSGLVSTAGQDDPDAQAGGQHGNAAAAAGGSPALEAYWRNSYTQEPYYEPGHTFDDYAPAYQVAWSTRVRAREVLDFEAAEQELRREWEAKRRGSRLTWEQAQVVMRAAWDRVDLDLTQAKSD